MLLPPPRFLLYRDEDQSCHRYRIQQGWGGGYRVVAMTQAWPPSEEFLLVLASATPFRRHLQTTTSNRRMLARLLTSMAEESFPFAPAETWYAFGERAGEPYIFALSRNLLEQWRQQEPLADLPMPSAILVGEGEPTVLRAVVEGWLAQGGVRDFLGGKVPIWHRGILHGALLAGLVMAGGWFGVMDLLQLRQNLAQHERQELGQWSQKAEELLKRRQVVVNMAATIDAVGQQAKQPGFTAITLLNKLLQAMPDGAAIRQVRLDPDGVVTVIGHALNPEAWLQAADITPISLDVTPLPNSNRFEAKLQASRS